MSKPKILFLDIETSPNVVLSFRVGQKVSLNPDSIIDERKIICICYKWAHERTVHSVDWGKRKCDASLLKKITKEIAKADIVIGHNGDRYDIPFINGRLLYHGLPPCNDITSIDTLKYSRSSFYLNSNKLDYLGKYLRLGQKIETGGFSLWKDITLNNCSKAMAKMIKYCKQDVLLLEKVYNYIKDYSKDKYHLGMLEGKDWTSCPNCGSYGYIKHGKRVTAGGGIKQRLQCKSCGKTRAVPLKKLEKSEHSGK